MGFFKTIIKTVLTADNKHIKRYDSANLFKSVILELCQNHGYEAFIRHLGRKQEPITNETDLSDKVNAELEIDVLNGTKKIFVGMGQSESNVISKMRMGAISQQDYIKLYSWSISEGLEGYFDTSFEMMRWIKEKEKNMIKNQKQRLDSSIQN